MAWRLALVSVVAGVLAGAAQAAGGWKTIYPLNGYTAVSIPASWPRDNNHRYWAEYWGYEDGRGNLAIAWFKWGKSAAAWKAYADHVEHTYSTLYPGAVVSSRRVTLGVGHALGYVVTYDQRGIHERNWDYYFLRDGRGYEFSYDCEIQYAGALQSVFARSAQSIRWH